MSSYSQMRKIGLRCVALSSHFGIMDIGALIYREISTTATTYRNNFRPTSTRTSAASPRSGKKPTAEDDEEGKYRKAGEYIRMHACKSSSSSSSSENVSSGANQAQRENYNEKQSDTHVDFQKVREPPPPSNEQWWYPDPFTGHYVPRNNYGEISRSVVLKEEKDIPRKQVLDDDKDLKKPSASSSVSTKISGVPSKGEKGG